MPRGLRLCFGLSVALLAIAFARAARAEDPTPAPAASVDLDDPSEVPLGRARPAPPDTRTGHVLLSGNASFLSPGGSFSDSLAQSGVVSIGPSFGGTLGLGVGRSAVVEIGGSYAKLSPSTNCLNLIASGAPRCSGSSYEIGLGLVYHVAQGIAVDPWISYGVAFRATSLAIPEVLAGGGLLPGSETSISYKGIDVARFAMGGDFYPIPELGFGPYIEADFGSYFWRTAEAGVVPPGSVYAFFGVGLRVTLDPVRFFSAPRAAEQPKAARALPETIARPPGVPRSAD